MSLLIRRVLESSQRGLRFLPISPLRQNFSSLASLSTKPANGPLSRAASPPKNDNDETNMLSAPALQRNLFKLVEQKKFIAANNLINGILNNPKMASKLTSGIFPTAFRGYIKANQPEKVVDYFRRIVNDAKVVPEINLVNEDIRAHMQLGQVDSAMASFANIRTLYNLRPDSYTFAYMLEGLMRHNRKDDAMRLFTEMKEVYGVRPTNYHYTTMITGLLRLGSADTARKLFDELNSSTSADPAYQTNAVVFSAMITGYLRMDVHDALSKALEIFELGKRQGRLNVYSYSALMDFHAQHHSPHLALALYSDMKTQNVNPTAITYLILLNMYCKQDDITSAMQILMDINSAGLDLDANFMNPILAAVIRTRSVQEAVEFIKNMDADGIRPKTSTYNIVMSALCRQGTAEGMQAAESVRKWMEEKKIVPDNVSYATLMSGYCETGDMAGAFNLLSEIPLEHAQTMYEVLVSFCARSGDIDTMKEIVQSMETRNVTKSLCIYHGMIQCYVASQTTDKFAKCFEIIEQMKLHGVSVDQIPYQIMMGGADRPYRLQLLQMAEQQRLISLSTKPFQLDVHFHVSRHMAEVMVVRQLDLLYHHIKEGKPCTQPLRIVTGSGRGPQGPVMRSAIISLFAKAFIGTYAAIVDPHNPGRLLVEPRELQRLLGGWVRSRERFMSEKTPVYEVSTKEVE